MKGILNWKKSLRPIPNFENGIRISPFPQSITSRFHHVNKAKAITTDKKNTLNESGRLFPFQNGFKRPTYGSDDGNILKMEWQFSMNTREKRGYYMRIFIHRINNTKHTFRLSSERHTRVVVSSIHRKEN